MLKQQYSKEQEDLILKNFESMLSDIKKQFEENQLTIKKDEYNKTIYPIINTNYFKDNVYIRREDLEHSDKDWINVYSAEKVTWDNINTIIKFLNEDATVTINIMNALNNGLNYFVIPKRLVYGNYQDLKVSIGDYIMKIEGKYWVYNDYNFNQFFVKHVQTNEIDIDLPNPNKDKEETSLGELKEFNKEKQDNPQRFVKEQLINALQTLSDVRDMLEEINWDVVYDILEEND